MKKETKLIEKTLAHWDRMIDVAKEQEAEKRPDSMVMLVHLKEQWFASNCSLCSVYSRMAKKEHVNYCDLCPLGKKFKG